MSNSNQGQVLVASEYDNVKTIVFKASFNLTNESNKGMNMPRRLIMAFARADPETLPARLGFDMTAAFGSPNVGYLSLYDIINKVIQLGDQVPQTVVRDMLLATPSDIQFDDIGYMYFHIWYGQGHRAPEKMITLLQTFGVTDEELIRAFGEPDSPTLYDVITNYYNDWKETNNNYYAEDWPIIRQIVHVQNALANAALNNQDTALTTELIVNSRTVSFTPRLLWVNVQPVSATTSVAEHGPDIFNKSFVNKYTPFVKYVDATGQPQIRVYEGTQNEDTPDFTIIRPPDSETSERNTIYITLWLGDPQYTGQEKIKDAHKVAFRTIVYQLAINNLSIESAVDAAQQIDINIAVDRARVALPLLDFGTQQEDKVRGEFALWNFKMEEATFLDMMLNDLVLNVSCYVEETSQSFAVKKNFVVHYVPMFTTLGQIEEKVQYVSNSSLVSFTMKQLYSQTAHMIRIVDPQTGLSNDRMTIEQMPFVHVNILTGRSIADTNRFINILRLLCRYYSSFRLIPQSRYNMSLTQKYNMYAPNDQQVEIALRNEQTQNYNSVNSIGVSNRPDSRQENNLKQLGQRVRAAFPVIHNVCPGVGKKPTVMTLAEAIQWHEQGKQIIDLPLEDGTTKYYGCVSDTYKYPGFGLDPTNNAPAYYRVCCFLKDHMNPNKQSHYMDWLNGSMVREKGAAGGARVIRNTKILNVGGYGELPDSMRTLFRPHLVNHDFYRTGQPRTPNSFLHCIHTAMRDQVYLSLTPENREAYVIEQRREIARNTLPALLKQEMYDYDDADIIKIMADPTVFLDPFLYFRALERRHNLNIYVFKLDKTGDERVIRGDMEVPRHHSFHSRPQRNDLPVVLILKNWDTNANGDAIPHCELIVDTPEPPVRDTNVQIGYFGREMDITCHRTLEMRLRTISWSVVEKLVTTTRSTSQENINDSQRAEPEETRITRNLVARDNIYSHLDYIKLFRAYAPVSQYLDDYGKLRAITFVTYQKEKFTISTVPSQPLNLPVTEDVSTVSFSTIYEILGQPTAKSVVSTLADGVWYRIMDMDYGLYVTIQPTNNDILSSLPVGPRNPLRASSNVSYVSRLVAMRRTANLFVQMLFYMYDTARLGKAVATLEAQYGKGPGVRPEVDLMPEEFAKRYFIEPVANGQTDSSFFSYTNNMDVGGDSALYYDLSRIEREFPTGDLDRVMGVFNRLAPSMVTRLDTPSKRWNGVITDVAGTNTLPIPQVGYNIVMYSSSFGTRCLRLLQEHYSQTERARLRRPRFIHNFYRYYFDYAKQPHSRVFVGLADLNAWLRSRNAESNLTWLIRSEINMSMGDSVEPYIYRVRVRTGKNTYGYKLFLIQNVVVTATREESIRLALSVAEIWHRLVVNVGPFPPITVKYGIEGDRMHRPQHMIYSIANENVVPTEAHLSPGYTGPYFHILFYGSPEMNNVGMADGTQQRARFGAMLPMRQLL